MIDKDIRKCMKKAMFRQTNASFKLHHSDRKLRHDGPSSLKTESNWLKIRVYRMQLPSCITYS